jgi:hypothetical protein
MRCGRYPLNTRVKYPRKKDDNGLLKNVMLVEVGNYSSDEVSSKLVYT